MWAAFHLGQRQSTRERRRLYARWRFTGRWRLSYEESSRYARRIAMECQGFLSTTYPRSSTDCFPADFSRVQGDETWVRTHPGGEPARYLQTSARTLKPHACSKSGGT